MTEMTRIPRDAKPLVVTEWSGENAERTSAPWVRWAGPILSIAIIVAVADALGKRDLGALWHMTPSSPFFWGGLVLFLAIQPVADFLIFRGLWPLPLAGLGALFRKSASNELLFGYSGELQFYLWARRHASVPGSPFGAVRDVSMMSALVGNVVTLVLLGAAIPALGDVKIGSMGTPMIWSAVALIGSSMAVMLFRRQLFSLSHDQLWRIAGLHLARSVAMTLMVGLLWAMVMPSIAVGWWVLLAAARQFITRLPFLPNKDLVFAAVAAGAVSNVPNVAETVALVAGVIFIGQVLIGAALALADLAQEAVGPEESR